MSDNQIPVYLFTGFLEGGKTSFIQNTLTDKEFNTGENILIICCEEGTEEYDPRVYENKNVYMETVLDEKKLTRSLIMTFIRKSKPKHIMIEYNGMWLISTLYNALPDNCFIFNEMYFADANTFVSYNSNMRQLVTDKLSTCGTVIFNRAKKSIDKDAFHKIVRGVSRRTQIAFEYEDGTVYYDETEDPLPFDINADIIEIEDRDYAYFYRDISEDMKKYKGKTVRFKGLVFNERRMGSEFFLMGRHLMVCCQNDITYRAFVCKYTVKPDFKTNSWATVTAEVTIGKNKLYDGEGPMLIIKEIDKAEAPAQSVATFY